MILQHIANAVDIGLRAGIFGFISRNFIAGTLKKAEQALFFFVYIEFFQFNHYVGQHFANLTHVLGANIVESRFRKIGDFFLRAGTVLKN